MIRFSRIVLISSTVLAAACASDETTAPAIFVEADARLAAVAGPPTAAISGQMVTLRVAVTSALPESVTGGVCADAIEARAVSGGTWSNVTSTLAACPTLAVQLAPGATINLTASADQSKLRTVAGSSTGRVVLRVRSTLNGATTTYTLQSNEVTFQLP